MRKIDLVILISGRGSNLQAIIDAVKSGQVSAQIKAVISNVPGVQGLERAKKHGIPAVVVNHKDYSDKKAYEAQLLKTIDSYSPGLICLAGYMRIVGQEIIKKYKWKIINIHPALLPSFSGLHAQRQAIEARVKESGCTVHFVDEGCDTGPIILQKTVPVLPGDTEASLSARILTEEHKLYPKAIQLISEGRVNIKDRKVIIKE
ncbi:MAG: phosphoribosylglycinamide formyltransferase [Candidatus Margulisiibacteriota bacterium]